MNARYKVISPLFITFLVLTVVIFSAKIFDAGRRMDYNVLMGANCLFFLVSLLVFRIQYKAMHHSNPHVFIRSVMSGLIIKMFTCIAAVVVYYFSAGENFNKPAVYVSMVIYMIFLVVEVRTIMMLNKQKNA